MKKNNYWKDKSIFITGGTGFIGSHLVRRLLSYGAKVTLLIRSVNGQLDNKDILDKCNVYLGDVRDFNLLCEIISSDEISHIFHLAAYSIVRISSKDPLNCFSTNVMGTVNILEAARQVGKCSKIICSSSDKAYGDQDELPYTTGHFLNPRNVYDCSKAGMDMIARAYRNNYGMPITVTRCSNVYGEGDNNSSRIIPSTILRLLNGQPPLVYKNCGNIQREFIHIDDVVEAYITLGQEHTSEVYNIGTNSPITVAELIQLISKLTVGKEIEPELIEKEASFKEIRKQYIDYTLLKEHFGWEPKIKLEDGLQRVVEWYKNNA